MDNGNLPTHFLIDKNTLNQGRITVPNYFVKSNILLIFVKEKQITMKYIPYTIWMILSAVMILTMFPAMVCYAFTNWFDLGDKILKSN